MPRNENTMSGNKGEWSELYAFMKLLAQGRMYAAGKNIQKVGNLYYPIIKIMREENKGQMIDYVIRDDDVDIVSGIMTVGSVSKKEFDANANLLMQEILRGAGSFEVEKIAEFLNGIMVTKIKAPPTCTTDIFMQLQDVNTSYAHDVGFSVKSELSTSKATLLNAGRATNFTYKVNGITSEQAGEINAINTRTKLHDRIARIYELGGNIEFYDLEHKGFKKNLNMLDGDIVKILGNMLPYYYRESVRECSKLLSILEERDPLGYNDPMFYNYKFKEFLCACALGLRPVKPWTGEDEANGGYIIVKGSGEVLAYHIRNRRTFKQYLLENTVLEKPSSTRHGYMNLYEKDGSMYLKLNLQIRFK